MGKGLDLVGQRFDRLTVVEYLYSDNTNNRQGRMWRCKCDCGGEKIVSTHRLIHGIVSSCGCKQVDSRKESGKANRKVKKLFEEKKPDILSAMSEFADIAQKGRDALVAGRKELIADLVNANFDLRDRIFNVAELNRNMVMTARESGASAKFAGSGGAIVGTYEDEAQFALLSAKLSEIGCTTFKPSIAINDEAYPGSNTNSRSS